MIIVLQRKEYFEEKQIMQVASLISDNVPWNKTILCLKKELDPCYITFSNDCNSPGLIWNIFCTRNHQNQHLVAPVTLWEILRTEYQLRWSCCTHSSGNCTVIVQRNNNVSHEVIEHYSINMLISDIIVRSYNKCLNCCPFTWTQAWRRLLRLSHCFATD